MFLGVMWGKTVPLGRIAQRSISLAAAAGKLY